MIQNNSNSTVPKAPPALPAITKYQAAAKTAAPPAAPPPAAKHDQVEVSSEAKARLAAEQMAVQEHRRDQRDG